MKLLNHTLAALPLAGAMYAATGSAPAACGAAAFSVLVDLDHLPDYIWWRRRKSSFSDFFQTNRQHQTPVLCLALHSWEFIVPGGLLLWALCGPFWAGSLSLGWLYHLIWDQITNPAGAGFYFFFYRASRGFKRAKLPVRQPARITP